MALVKVVSVGDVKKAKNGREYKVATFCPAVTTKTHSLEGQTFVEELITWRSTRVIWGPLVKDGKVTFKADSNFDSIAEGKVYGMDLHTYRTSPYDINGRMQDKITVLCYDVEFPVEVINAKLKSQNAFVVATMEGEPISPPVWATAPKMEVDKTPATVAETAKA